MIQRILIYVSILLGLVGTCKWGFAAGQETFATIPKTSTGNYITTIREAVNTNFATQHTMNTELYAHIAAGNPWVAQATAPADTTKLWFDTDDQPGYVVLKIYTGGVWVAHKIGNDYTLPTAAADTLGGVKVGSRLSITDGVLSADVQSTDISGKQDTLVSGTNIKTINSTSLLGSGNITISGTLTDGTVVGQVPVWNGSAWNNSLLGAGYISVSDLGGYWTANTVEGVLAETGAFLSNFINFSATLPLVWNSLTGTVSIQVDTDLTTVSGSDDTVPSAKAVKDAMSVLETNSSTVINWTTTIPTSANTAGIWVNSTNGHTYIVGTQGVVDIPSSIAVADTTPNSFGFNEITDATPGADYWSDAITVTGIDSYATISATTAYRINGGDPITSDGTVSLNDSVELKLTASNTAGDTVTGNATIGGVAGSPAFSVTTSSSTSYVLAENNVAITGSEALLASTGGKGQDFIPTSTKLLRAVQVYVTSYSEGAQIQCRYDSTADMTTPVDTATSAVITSNGYVTIDFGADHTLTSGTRYYFGCVYLNAPASIGYAADSYADGSYRYAVSGTGWNLGTAVASKDLVFRVIGE